MKSFNFIQMLYCNHKKINTLSSNIFFVCNFCIKQFVYTQVAIMAVDYLLLVLIYMHISKSTENDIRPSLSTGMKTNIYIKK